MRLVWAFGEAPNCVEAPEKSLLTAVICACTSIPITTSQPRASARRMRRVDFLGFLGEAGGGGRGAATGVGEKAAAAGEALKQRQTVDAVMEVRTCRLVIEDAS